MSFFKKSEEQLASILEESYAAYNEYKSKGLKLDMSRGKPSPAQLELSIPMLDVVDSGSSCQSENGFDCRNYGELSGISEMKRIFSEMMGIPEEQIFIGGNSTLNLMFHTFSRAFVKGLPDSLKPWSNYETIKFLCPVPGYDRHFAASEYFGMELIEVPLTKDGPDMDIVEQLVRDDDAIKGIWCVPIFSNPDGCVYSPETVVRLAKMECAAPDFTIMWDNAYCVHSLYKERITLPNILDECRKYGHENRPLHFTSTNKITFAGSGVCCAGGSEASMKYLLETAAISTIGYDKINMLRHARFLKNLDNIHFLMDQHAALLRPKFETVLSILDNNLSKMEIAEWTSPRGGYFISLNALPGTAKRVYELCKEAGVTLTGPGAAYPYGNDREDKNIRIAPSYPSIDELKDATEILSLTIKIAAAESILEGRNSSLLTSS